MKKTLRYIIQILMFVFILIAVFISYHFYTNVTVTTNEVYRHDEAEQIERSIANFSQVIEKNKTSYATRGAHAKGHACVKAYFSVLDDIASEFQHGVFQTPGRQYKAWIRFSNGRSSIKANHDADKDAHGMALKLINIYDDKLIKTPNSPATHDFLMHDHPVFFVSNMEDYNRFVESPDKIKFFVENKNPLKWQLRELKHGLDTLKSPPNSPLQVNYFSNTAYKLGPHNIKFSAQPCTSEKNTFKQDKSDPDFLRHALAETLANSDACFDFMVQRQIADKYMPIEDPSIQWQESDSPFIKLASITIPTQEFQSKSQQDFCENITFSPWNSLPQHRPIGELNRIRKKVYEASANYRHHNNKTMPPTELDW